MGAVGTDRALSEGRGCGLGGSAPGLRDMRTGSGREAGGRERLEGPEQTRLSHSQTQRYVPHVWPHAHRHSPRARAERKRTHVVERGWVCRACPRTPRAPPARAALCRLPGRELSQRRPPTVQALALADPGGRARAEATAYKVSGVKE